MRLFLKTREDNHTAGVHRMSRYFFPSVFLLFQLDKIGHQGENKTSDQYNNSIPELLELI